MDKGQALQSFWGGFGLPAYEENTVDEKAVMPYITYEVRTDSYDTTVTLYADLWYYSRGWKDADKKADEIFAFIGIGGVVIKINNGYMWVKRGHPFSQHAADPNDTVRRVRLSIEVDFLTD